MKGRSKEEECYELWVQCFGDSKKYTDFYFNTVAGNNIILTNYEEDTLASMLHLNPYQLNTPCGEKLLHYIVGVATHPKQRKKGKMRHLLMKAFAEMYERREPFTYLSPASEQIYRPFGFDTFYVQKRLLFDLKEASSAYEDIDLLSMKRYEHCTEIERNKVVQFSSDLLSKHFHIYAKRDEFYYHKWNEEMQAAGGGIFVLFYKQQVVGVIPFMWEEGNGEIIECMIDQTKAVSIVRMLNYTIQTMYGDDKGETLSYHESYFCRNELKNIPGLMEQTDKLYIMARIIHLEEFFRCIPQENSMFEKIQYFEVIDDEIPMNQGIYLCEAMENMDAGYRLKKLENWPSNVTKKTFRIEEIQRNVWKNWNVYLNEVV